MRSGMYCTADVLIDRPSCTGKAALEHDMKLGSCCLVPSAILCSTRFGEGAVVADQRYLELRTDATSMRRDLRAHLKYALASRGACCERSYRHNL